MKTCSKCNKTKPSNDFSKAKNKNDGLQSQCKTCAKQYRQENAEKLAEKSRRYRQENAERIAENNRRYYQKNAEKLDEKSRRYRQENAERIAEYEKQYRKKNAEKFAEHNKRYQKKRIKTDSLFKFKCNVRVLILGSFKRNRTKKWRKQTKTEQLLGCTIEQLHEHLAKQFLPGMSLENHGEWHIDHIIPLASAKTQQDIERLCHYTNLQPLWAEDNIKKGARE